MVGTPAYEAGILAGDQIVEIDGQSAEGMSPDKAVEVLTGRPGTDVKLNVVHEGSEDPETIAITRAIIDIPSVLGDRRKPDDQWDFMLDQDKKIGYVRIAGFMQNTTDELKKALAQLKDEGMKGLILDLRDDPGGLFSAAVEVSDLFLDKGEIVSTKGRNTSPGPTGPERWPLRGHPHGRADQPELGFGRRDRLGGAPGPQAGRDRRPAVLRQGLGAEHPRSRGRQ